MALIIFAAYSVLFVSAFGMIYTLGNIMRKLCVFQGLQERGREGTRRLDGALCPNECRHSLRPTQTALPAVGHLVLICP